MGNNLKKIRVLLLKCRKINSRQVLATICPISKHLMIRLTHFLRIPNNEEAPHVGVQPFANSSKILDLLNISCSRKTIEVDMGLRLGATEAPGFRKWKADLEEGVGAARVGVQSAPPPCISFQHQNALTEHFHSCFHTRSTIRMGT